MTIKPSDIVRLKSGGPQMTVIQGQQGDGFIRTNETLLCYWFDKNQTLNRAWFEHASVEIIEQAKT